MMGKLEILKCKFSLIFIIIQLIFINFLILIREYNEEYNLIIILDISSFLNL